MNVQPENLKQCDLGDSAPKLIIDVASLDGAALPIEATLDCAPRRLMSAGEYRTRAEALVTMADAPVSYDLILEAESLAKQWRSLGALADWQDAMLEALAKTEFGAPSRAADRG